MNKQVSTGHVFMKNKILIVFFILLCDFSYAYGDLYCTKINLCYSIPEDFILVTKQSSERTATFFKERFPNQYIGFYADLYGTFYNNKMLPVDRVYLMPVESGFLFITFITKGANEDDGHLGHRVREFRKMGAFKKRWPRQRDKMKSLEQAFDQGVKQGLTQPNQRTGIQSGSAKILWISQNKKYLAAQRTLDINEIMIEKMRDSGFPMTDQNKMAKVMTDSYAIQFNERGMVVMQFFGDITADIANYYPLFKKVLDDAK